MDKKIILADKLVPDLKNTIINSTIRSTVLRTAESGILSLAVRKRLDAFQMWTWREWSELARRIW